MIYLLLGHPVIDCEHIITSGLGPKMYSSSKDAVDAAKAAATRYGIPVGVFKLTQTHHIAAPLVQVVHDVKELDGD